MTGRRVTVMGGGRQSGAGGETKKKTGGGRKQGRRKWGLLDEKTKGRVGEGDGRKKTV